MAQSQFSLTWNSHTRNVCNGLSIFQQNSEFVDMTLAADGHFVKVHQIVLALASPYIKDLLASIPCPHPVLFLNNISYNILCKLLEYIYTGESVVSIEDLSELKKAAKELHIKGLENINLTNVEDTIMPDVRHGKVIIETSNGSNMIVVNQNDCFSNDTNTKTDEKIVELDLTRRSLPKLIEDKRDNELMDDNMESGCDSELPYREDEFSTENSKETQFIIHNIKNTQSADDDPTMQYTVSNQGSLQMILNRFIYYLKHTNRDNTQQWRCVDYVTHLKCPAHVITKNGMVYSRIAAHRHSFHDKKILKKIRSGSVFSAMTDAENRGVVLKNRTADGKTDNSE